MTRKVAPSYDGKSSFENAIDDWRDITKPGLEKMRTCFGEQIRRRRICLQALVEERIVEGSYRRRELFHKILATVSHQRSSSSVSASVHAVHESCKRYNGFDRMDG